MKCSKCEYCKFHEGRNGHNYYFCAHPKSMRVVVHHCKRGDNDRGNALPLSCPQVNDKQRIK